MLPHVNNDQDSGSPYRAPAAAFSGTQEAPPGDEITLVLAHPLRRLAAVMLNGFILISCCIPGIVLAMEGMDHLKDQSSGLEPEEALVQSLNSVTAFGAAAIFIPLSVFVIANIVLLVKNGQTLGKKILGIRIANDYGDNPGFWMIAIVRSLVPFMIGLLPLFGLIFILADSLFIFSERNRCLHDRIANTIVVMA